jgi:hypothetical protein
MEAAVANKKRRAAATLFALVLTAVGITVTGAPAQAVPGLHDVQGESTTSSATFRTATATCPPGTKVYGGQAIIVTGNGNVALDGVVPSADLQSLTVFATEIGAYTQLWRLEAHAICGQPVANLQRVGPIFSSLTDSSSSKPAAANCPGGLRLYGVGADITAGFGRVAVVGMVPGETVGVVRTHELFGSFQGNWTSAAYAICGAPSANMQIRTATSTTSIQNTKDATVACPSGTLSHQVGASVLPISTSNVLLNTMTDIAGTQQVARAEAWQAGGVAVAPWSLTVVALCSS